MTDLAETRRALEESLPPGHCALALADAYALAAHDEVCGWCAHRRANPSLIKRECPERARLTTSPAPRTGEEGGGK